MKISTKKHNLNKTSMSWLQIANHWFLFYLPKKSLVQSIDIIKIV